MVGCRLEYFFVVVVGLCFLGCLYVGACVCRARARVRVGGGGTVMLKFVCGNYFFLLVRVFISVCWVVLCFLAVCVCVGVCLWVSVVSMAIEVIFIGGYIRSYIHACMHS